MGGRYNSQARYFVSLPPSSILRSKQDGEEVGKRRAMRWLDPTDNLTRIENLRYRYHLKMFADSASHDLFGKARSRIDHYLIQCSSGCTLVIGVQ